MGDLSFEDYWRILEERGRTEPLPGQPGDLTTLDELANLPGGTVIKFTSNGGHTWEYAKIMGQGGLCNYQCRTGEHYPCLGVAIGCQMIGPYGHTSMGLTAHTVERGCAVRLVDPEEATGMRFTGEHY